MSDWLFELEDVGLRFGRVQALQGCTLRIAAGERVALVGANGSGKSSLLRCLHGLLVPTEGRMARTPGRQAMVFQRPYMWRASVLHQVALGLWLAGTPWRLARQQALAALQRVGLDAVAQRSAHSLSGGQQQRLAMARAWALRPQVLLLDEPTSSLDPAGKKDIEALMADFAAEGATLIFSSHNMGQVKRLASRVIYLEQGQVRVDAPVALFFNKAVPSAATAFLQGELS
jgi:tungstate transport system ATP-binding protein